MALVGAVLMTRAPGNRVGDLLLIAATMLMVSAAAGAWSVAAAGTPGAGLAGLINDVFFIPPLVLLLIGVPLIFPDGHLLSARWRWAVWLTTAAIVALTISKLFATGAVGPADTENPLGAPSLAPLVAALGAFSTLTAPVGFGAAVAAVIVRFRRGQGIERQQLKWFLAVAGISALAFLVSLVPIDPIPWVAFAIAFCGLIAMPIAIGIAILRYRLYEIDRLVSRTISYAVVTGGLIAVFLAVNLTLTSAFGAATNENSLVVAASTLVVAALFTPLRRRVQRIVDRRFDRARYDGERTDGRLLASIARRGGFIGAVTRGSSDAMTLVAFGDLADQPQACGSEAAGTMIPPVGSSRSRVVHRASIATCCPRWLVRSVALAPSARASSSRSSRWRRCSTSCTEAWSSSSWPSAG